MKPTEIMKVLGEETKKKEEESEMEVEEGPKKRHLSGYNVFFKEQVPEIKKKNPSGRGEKR